MRTAASIIDQYIKVWLEKILLDCKGEEHKALMELIRSTDLHAMLLQIGNILGPDPYGIPRGYSNIIQKGISMLLNAFLSKIDPKIDKSSLGDIQPAEAVAWADEVLRQAGELSHIRHLAYLERQNVVSCKIESDKAITIIIEQSNLESLEREDEYAVLDAIREQQKQQRDQVEKEISEWLKRPIDEYAVADHHGIREIRFNEPLFRIFERQAQLQINEYAESDLFPDEVVIGARTFGDWKKIAATLTALSYLHQFYAIKIWRDLPEPMQHLGTLRHLLPAIHLDDELSEKWNQALELSGIDKQKNIESAFILTLEDAKDYAAKNDHPSPLGIRIASLIVTPQFGYLGNSFSFLANNLEKLYPASWEAGKDRREAGFQAELSTLFSSANYTTGYTNIKIRGIDGRTSTDIDSVLYEHSENCVYLVQLKWPSPYTTPNQRSSRIKNLQDANDWIGKVSEWQARTINRDILQLFGLHKIQCDIENLKVRLIVLSRIWTRFGGEVNQDSRAAWISWSRLRYLCLENHRREDPLNVSWTVAVQGDNCPFTPQGHTRTLNFESLKVSICT